MRWELTSEDEKLIDRYERLRYEVEQDQKRVEADQRRITGELDKYPEIKQKCVMHMVGWISTLRSSLLMENATPEDLEDVVEQMRSGLRRFEAFRQEWGFTPFEEHDEDEARAWSSLMDEIRQRAPEEKIGTEPFQNALVVSKRGSSLSMSELDNFGGSKEEVEKLLAKLLGVSTLPASRSEWLLWKADIESGIRAAAEDARKRAEELLTVDYRCASLFKMLEEWVPGRVLREDMAEERRRRLESLVQEMQPLYDKVREQYEYYIDSTILPEEEGEEIIYPIGRPFGVEIECTLPAPLGTEDREKVAAYLFKKMDIDFQGWDAEGYEKWGIKVDSSVKCFDRGASGAGLEMVSPVLRGEEGQRELRRVMNSLRAIGAEVNVTCGTHVHLGVPELVGPYAHDEQKALIRNYSLNEPEIGMVLPPERREGGYGGEAYLDHSSQESLLASRRKQEALFAEKEEDPNAAITSAAEKTNSLGKYSKVKMTGIGGPTGSCEFRQHHGTLDPDSILEWTLAMEFLVDTAVRHPEKCARLEARAGALRYHLRPAEVVDDPMRTLLTPGPRSEKVVRSGPRGPGEMTSAASVRSAASIG